VPIIIGGNIYIMKIEVEQVQNGFIVQVEYMDEFRNFVFDRQTKVMRFLKEVFSAKDPSVIMRTD
jgi:hypothetical protein